MEFSTFLETVKAKAFLSKNISYKSVKNLYMMMAERGFDDIAIEELISKLDEFGKVNNQIHLLDISINDDSNPLTDQQLATLKTNRHTLVTSVESIRKEIDFDVREYLCIQGV
jgi:hypothetical protein